MKWRRVFGAVLAVTLVTLTACSGDKGGGGEASGSVAGEKVTLDFWVFESGGIGSFLETLKSSFEEANPNISLNITAYPENGYGTKLDTAIAAGKAPDLVLVFGPEYMRQGLLLPLDDMVASHNIDLSTYSQAIVQPGDEFSCAFEDHLYCLGSYQGTTMLLYNKDMFDAAGIAYPAPYPPMTPDQFVDYACRLTDPAKPVWGAAASDPMSYLPWEMFVSADGKTAEGYVNSPETVHQFDILGKAFQQKCLPSMNILDPWEQGRDFFAKGQLAMVITDFQDLKKVESAGINYGATAPPTPTGYEPYFFVWTDSVGVMASSEHPDQAMEFVAYVTTEGQRIRFETSGDIPIDTTVAEEVNWANDIPGRLDGLEVLKHARTGVFIPNRWDVMGPLWDAFGFITGGEKTAQQALDDVAPAIQENLDKAWEVWNREG